MQKADAGLTGVLALWRPDRCSLPRWPVAQLSCVTRTQLGLITEPRWRSTEASVSVSLAARPRQSSFLRRATDLDAIRRQQQQHDSPASSRVHCWDCPGPPGTARRETSQQPFNTRPRRRDELVQKCPSRAASCNAGRRRARALRWLHRQTADARGDRVSIPQITPDLLRRVDRLGALGALFQHPERGQGSNRSHTSVQNSDTGTTSRRWCER